MAGMARGFSKGRAQVHSAAGACAGEVSAGRPAEAGLRGMAEHRHGAGVAHRRASTTGRGVLERARHMLVRAHAAVSTGPSNPLAVQPTLHRAALPSRAGVRGPHTRLWVEWHTITRLHGRAVLSLGRVCLVFALCVVWVCCSRVWGSCSLALYQHVRLGVVPRVLPSPFACFSAPSKKKEEEKEEEEKKKKKKK